MKKRIEQHIHKGRIGDLVVSVLVFHADNPSSYPAEACSFFLLNIVWKEWK